MMSKRFLLTLTTLIVIGLAATGAIFLAKGYRLSSKNGTIAGTGILSITSVPDQASVYLDGHLTTATNANINSLLPKTYDVKIIKEGYIPWQKKVEVKEGLVSDVKATLFRAIPTIYPLTYTGAVNPLLSPDGQKLVYVVPSSDERSSSKKSGLWVWEMSDKSIAFARGAQPHQIGLPPLDYTKAKLRWSPDSAQLLVSFSDQQLLFDVTRLNDPPRDITAIIDPTLKSWDDDQRGKDLTRLQVITDLNLRKTASEAAVLKWSPDETKFLFSTVKKNNHSALDFSYKVVDLVPNKGLTKQTKTYELPPSAKGYDWLPDSEHLFLVETTQTSVANLPQPSISPSPTNPQSFAKISVIEFDGGNKSEIYAGNFSPDSVFVWPDGSRLVIVSSLPIVTAAQPNLFGINLK